MRLIMAMLGGFLIVAWSAIATAQVLDETTESAQETASLEDRGNNVYREAFQRGNTAYNEGRYQVAREAYIDAIQADPDRARAYRNLGRTFFWMGDYSAAVAYYDHYLRLDPAADDRDQIKSERRLAAERAGDNVWSLSDAQRLTLAALNDELETGRAYTRGGGGAFGLYQTLLRTGYAHPDLRRTRTRLVRRLLDEFEALVIPRTGELTPQLDLEGWQLQAERLGVARSLTEDRTMRDLINRRSTIVEAAISLLTGSPAEAAELARLARSSNPDLKFARWYEVAALLEAEKHEEALQTTEQIARELLQEDRGKLDYVKVLRAVVLRRLERDEDAASIYLDLLSGR